MYETKDSGKFARTRTRWLVIADSARARICVLDAYNNVVREVEHHEQAASRLRGAALATDRQGRSFDTAGAGRHAMENRHAVRLGPVGKFARFIADRLERGRRAGEFDEVLVAAPPRFLGMLRRHLDAETTARVACEIPKNLVGADDKALRRAVLAAKALPGLVRS